MTMFGGRRKPTVRDELNDFERVLKLSNDLLDCTYEKTESGLYRYTLEKEPDAGTMDQMRNLGFTYKNEMGNHVFTVPRTNSLLRFDDVASVAYAACVFAAAWGWYYYWTGEL